LLVLSLSSFQGCLWLRGWPRGATGAQAMFISAIPYYPAECYRWLYCILLFGFLFTLGFQESSFAQITGHYPPGVEGIKNGSAPPPGQYTKMYNFFYYADTLRTGSGSKVKARFGLFNYVVALRHLWMTETKILGADYGLDMAVPFVYTDLTLGPLDERQFGLGDIFVEPLVLGWHYPGLDLSFAYSFFAPTGNFDVSRPASPGKGFWSHILAFGITYYLDAERTWAISTAHRFEFNTENKDLRITPGTNYYLEWGISKAITPTVEVGLVGYFQRQLTDDRGSGVTYDAGVHDQVAGTGLEVSLFIPSLKLNIQPRLIGEFAAKDRAQGFTGWIVFTKIW
jgi:hypothetical protein